MQLAPLHNYLYFWRWNNVLSINNFIKNSFRRVFFSKKGFFVPDIGTYCETYGNMLW